MQLFQGRLNRRNYFFGSMLLAGIAEIATLLRNLLLSHALSSAFINIYVIIVILSIFFCISITIRRLHDVGSPGFAWIFLSIPVINVFLVLILLYKSGEKTPNRYGEVPSKVIFFPGDILGNSKIGFLVNKNMERIFYIIIVILFFALIFGTTFQDINNILAK